jgi:transposase InsO family protein
VVDVFRWTESLNMSQLKTAERLGLAPRTVRQWLHDACLGSPPIQLCGRPVTRSDPEERTAVSALLQETGPQLGLPALQTRFPNLARAELHDLLVHFRCGWLLEHPRELHVLHWQKPGTVWAMDFAEAPKRIDGLPRYLLAVRDLGSGKQLTWLPVETMNAPTVIAELQLLFTIDGPPLVLKSDNGSPFVADVLQKFLQRWQVIPLFSPPARPGYNGSCEASIRWLKVWTAAHAARQGHPEMWTTADVAAAKQHANEGIQAWGSHGPTREQFWQSRQPITTDTRQAFAATVQTELTTVLAEYRPEEGASPAQADMRACQRQAMQRALVAHGLLVLSRRRLSPQVTWKKPATSG